MEKWLSWIISVMRYAFRMLLYEEEFFSRKKASSQCYTENIEWLAAKITMQWLEKRIFHSFRHQTVQLYWLLAKYTIFFVGFVAILSVRIPISFDNASFAI
jgi:hypothetical protein